jgi:hypothetical protein
MRQSQVSNVSKQPLEAVNLWCVDWKNLRQQVDNAIKTQPGNALDDRHLNSMRRNLSQNVSTGSHFVLTELHLLLKSIRILPGRSLSKNQSIVIAVAWPGYHDKTLGAMGGLPFRKFSDQVFLLHEGAKDSATKEGHSGPSCTMSTSGRDGTWIQAVVITLYS